MIFEKARSFLLQYPTRGKALQCNTSFPPLQGSFLPTWNLDFDGSCPFSVHKRVNVPTFDAAFISLPFLVLFLYKVYSLHAVLLLVQRHFLLECLANAFPFCMFRMKCIQLVHLPNAIKWGTQLLYTFLQEGNIFWRHR